MELHPPCRVCPAFTPSWQPARYMEYKLKMTPDEVLESVAHNVAFAKKFCSDIEFSAEDATRSDLDFLCRVVETAIKAGATTINIPDTVGYMIPQEYASRIEYLREHTEGIENVILSCHMHNDLGMAVANSLAGVEAGIDQIECTINGIGERAGNASMEECVMALQDPCRPLRHRLQHRDHPDLPRKPHDPDHYRRCCCTDQADHRCKCVRTRGRHPPARRNGQQGNLRDHGLRNPSASRRTPSCSASTPAAMRSRERLHELGYTLDHEKLEKAFEKFKILADKKKVIKDRDLEGLIGAVPVSGEGALHARPLCHQLWQHHYLYRCYPRQEGRRDV